MWLCGLSVLLGWLSICEAGPVYGSLSKQEYMEERGKALAFENANVIGGDLILTPKEQYVNEIILNEKRIAIKEARLGNTPFLPAMSFVNSQPLIENTAIFKFLRKMPKGGVLHIHDTAMVSLDWVVRNVTYRDFLHMCQPENGRISFKFSDRSPENKTDCTWELVSDRREASGDVDKFDDCAGYATMYQLELSEVGKQYQWSSRSEFNTQSDLRQRELVQWLKREMSLLRDSERLPTMTTNEVWKSFLASFAVVGGFLLHEPVYRDYIYRSLAEHQEDMVQYLEIRIILSQTYNLDGTLNTVRSTLQLYKDVADEFRRHNPTTSSGAKIIITDIRFNNKSVIANTIADVLRFRKDFPGFIAGFDLVSQEDLGRPLLYYLDELLAPNKNDPSTLPYLFHAGETDWQGTDVDKNLIDAILLGTKRIGHGYAVAKHPWVMEQVKKRKIALEVQPVSNQVLRLVADIRNHQAITLIAQNYPIVISSDDPPMWGATGLTYDFYMAFMAMSSADSGLSFLKQLATNSLLYSSMADAERTDAFSIFSNQWDSFINEMAGNVTINVTSPTPHDPITVRPSGIATVPMIHSLTILITLIITICM